MINLREKIGRRVAVVAVVASAIIAVCAFSGIANAIPDPATALTDIKEVSINESVYAPRNADFTASYKLSFAQDTTDPSNVAAVKEAVFSNGKHISMDVKNGVILDGKFDASTKAYGELPSGADVKESNYDAYSTDKEELPTNADYIVGRKLTDFLLDSSAFLNNPGDYFPTTGCYIFNVTETVDIQNPTDAAWHPENSQTTYKMAIWYKNDGGTPYLGVYVSQTKHWGGDKIVRPKIDPTWKSGGARNIKYKVPGLDFPGNEYDVASGFTFTHSFNTTPTDEDTYQPFTLEKKVTGDYADHTKEFKFTVKFGSATWSDPSFNTASEILAKIVDASGSTVEDIKIAFDSKQNYPNNTWTEEKTVNLKDGYKLVFAGENSLNSLPDGTIYSIVEDDYSPQKYETSTVTTTANKADAISKSSNRKVNITNNDNAIISRQDATSANVNYCTFTNKCVDKDTGFMIDILPYLILIGIPVVAFAAWMVSRKKRFNA